MANFHRVVIVGGGFGGLYATQSLRKAAVSIVLIDKRNFHLFQPLLYQVATGALSPANIAAPLRAILKHQSNVTTLLGEVVDIDPKQRTLQLAEGNQVEYDTLIVAAGVRYNYFGNEKWAELAPSLKTIEDATEIRRRVLTAFEQAEKSTDPDQIRAYLTFVIIGGGPTGVELAGALGEIAHHTLRNNFRHIDPATAQILLIEGSDRVLPPYTPKSSQRASVDLQRLGVTVRTNCMVTDIQPDSVKIKCGDEVETIPTCTVLWAAGVQGVPLAKKLAAATGATLDRAGRIMVDANCNIKDHPNIFVIGDLANFSNQDGKPLPGVAQVAIQQGKYVANVIEAKLAGQPVPPFVYKDLGNMATVGRAAAVAELGSVHLDGLIGWLAWLFVHLINLIEFENRVLVLFQWGWSYLTRNRAARLITGERKP
ncbi:MAG: NAD(P)/FAD-dependent oxidoreductase [Caldilineaceae bacterium]